MKNETLDAFLTMLATERGAAENSLIAYRKDIEDYREFLKLRGTDELAANSIDIRDYLARLAR